LADETSESEEIAELRAELVKLILDDLRENQTDPIPLKMDAEVLDRLVVVWDERLKPLNDRIDKLQLELKAVTLSTEDRRQIQNLQKSVDAMYKKMTGAAPPKVSDKELEAQERRDAKERERQQRLAEGKSGGGDLLGRFWQKDGPTGLTIMLGIAVLALLFLVVKFGASMMSDAPPAAENPVETDVNWMQAAPAPLANSSNSSAPATGDRSITEVPVDTTPPPTATIQKRGSDPVRSQPKAAPKGDTAPKGNTPTVTTPPADKAAPEKAATITTTGGN
jgi:hypothetical protein